MRCIIDHFVGEQWAVLEFAGRQVFDFPRALLPADAVEGDVVRVATEVDAAETAKRRRAVEALASKLFTDES
ncbi:DUF3006 domain-containing protein [Tumebacillus permanentifrigoris]|uniref:DUF3006 family protein n=1 Tax=Tumebacillus permanentifrigoris TaxID=378543 RepID=A0A316D7A3_9BACL|nr:DUF3006 domain-containing protein [Tumebacillus permanentifrigoris]PWK10317.1 hypothetical protein C7459_112139 [Tumebacillus permanentifrigoris]